MPAKHCTSKKYKKPGVFVDYSSATTQSNSAFLQSLKAKKYQQIRNGGKKQQVAGASQQHNSNGKQQQEDENDEDDGEEDADESDNAGATEAESSSPPSELVTPEGLSISLTPFNPSFKASHSACATSTAESSLSDDKVLGAALYEWLLSKEGWDCHALWERFLLEWDLVTETERPPGTNRPLNLHGYLTGFRNTNNKHGARTQIKTVRDTLKMERAIAMRDAPEDPFSLLNQQALNGSLLMYYLKTKGLMPYESENQRKKKMAQLKRKRGDDEEEEAEGERKEAEGEEEEEEEQEAEEEEVQSHAAKQQPAKKGKVSHPPTKVPSASAPSKQKAPQSSKVHSSSNNASSSSSTSAAPASSLKLGQANAFAALLDCDD